MQLQTLNLTIIMQLQNTNVTTIIQLQTQIARSACQLQNTTSHDHHTTANTTHANLTIIIQLQSLMTRARKSHNHHCNCTKKTKTLQSGELNAVIHETLTVKLSTGVVVGEMAYFEGGKRNATINARGDSVIALIRFQVRF
jgi:hypothetical protein